jgi:hypothetical protein
LRPRVSVAVSAIPMVGLIGCGGSASSFSSGVTGGGGGSGNAQPSEATVLNLSLASEPGFDFVHGSLYGGSSFPHLGRLLSKRSITQEWMEHRSFLQLTESVEPGCAIICDRSEDQGLWPFDGMSVGLQGNSIRRSRPRSACIPLNRNGLVGDETDRGGSFSAGIHIAGLRHVLALYPCL